MKLTLEKVTIDNIMSIGHIELALDGRGVTLIEGRNLTDPSLTSNGTAKSSILGSIFYGIYGRFPAKEAVKSDDIINRKVGKKAKVVLEFSKDGHKYRVERSRKPNHVYFFCDDTDLTTNSASNTDKLIKQTVGISESLFMNAVLFDSINSKKFASMNDKERKEMFTELLNLDLYTRALELAKDDLAVMDDSIRDVQQAQTANKSAQQFYTQQIQREEEERQSRLIKVDNAKANLEARQQELENLRNGGTLARITELETQLTNVGNAGAIPSSQEEYHAYSQANMELTTTKGQLEAIKNEVTSLSNRREQFEKSSLCPECGSEMDMEHRQQEISKVDTRFSALLPEAKGVQQHIKELEDRVPVLYAQYTEAYAKQQEAQEQASSLSQRVAHINSELGAERNKLSQAEYQVGIAQNTYDTLVAQEPSKYTHQSELKEKETEYAALSEKLMELITKQEHIKNAVVAYSDKGIKSHLIDLTVPFLNERINEYLGTLTGSTISAEITTQKELTTGDKSDKIDLVVDNTAGAGSYGALSAGEKRRVDIAISLALQDLVMGKSELQINTLFYDEVFENLDEVGCENTIELLKKRTDLASSIYVITHNEKLKSLFNNVITVIKEDGFSRIEESNN